MTGAADFIDVADASGPASQFVALSSAGAVNAPPQIGLRGSVGSGKTRLYAQEITGVLAREPHAVAFVFVPDHQLSAEVARRIQSDVGPGFTVGIWRGTNQPDPDAPPGVARKMCQRSGDMDAVWEAAGTLKDLCGSSKRGFCPHHPKAGGDCGYIRQAENAKGGTVSVWVLPHSMLGRAAPEPLRRFIRGPGGEKIAVPAADIVAIDESFWRAMLGECAVSFGMTDPSLWPAVPDDPNALAPIGFADGLVCKVLGLLSGEFAKAGAGGRVGQGALAAAGLTAGECREAGGYILRCKEELPTDKLPTATRSEVKRLLLKLAANNRRALRVHRLLNVAADVLAGRLGSAALAVRDGKRGPEVALTWRDEIADDWLCAKYGVIHADATMSEEIARVWLPRLVVPTWTPVAAPHMRVVQIGDRAFGYSAVLTGSNSGVEGQKAAAANARRVLRAIKTLAVRHDGQGAPGGPDVLVVLPKALEDEFKGKLPANVGTLHFGKLRGQDGFKGVAVLLVVSRLMPPPAGVEDIAEIIFGRDVARLPPGFYPTRPGTRQMENGTGLAVSAVYYHPDALVELVRGACCEADLVQAVGRGRGIHRAAANPLEAIIMTNVPIDDVPVSEVVMLDDLWRDLAGTDPVLEMERAGVLPLDWPGRGAVLAGLGFFARAADPGEAARKLFGRAPGSAARLAEIEAAAAGGRCTNGGQTSYSNCSIGGLSAIRVLGPSAPTGVPAPANPAPAAVVWPSFRYRRACQRKAGRVLVAPRHADPRAAVEALIGTLDMFEPDSTPRTVKRTRRPGVTPDVTPAPAAPDFRDPSPVPPPVSLAVVPAPGPGLGPSITPAVAQDEDADLTAKLDAVTIGLPALMTELLATGAVSAAGRRLHMDRFRSGRGPLAVRERIAVARLSAELSIEAVANACRAAAARKLGISVPETSTQQAAS